MEVRLAIRETVGWIAAAITPDILAMGTEGTAAMPEVTAEEMEGEAMEVAGTDRKRDCAGWTTVPANTADRIENGMGG